MTSRRAFTLAELLVSLLILSSLAVVMVGVIPTTVIGVHAASERATAATLAREVLENLRRQGPQQIYDMEPPPATVNRCLYRLKVETAPVPGPDGVDLPLDRVRQVTVTVAWESRTGQRSLATSTYLGRLR